MGIVAANTDLQRQLSFVGYLLEQPHQPAGDCVTLYQPLGLQLGQYNNTTRNPWIFILFFSFFPFFPRNFYSADMMSAPFEPSLCHISPDWAPSLVCRHLHPCALWNVCFLCHSRRLFGWKGYTVILWIRVLDICSQTKNRWSIKTLANPRCLKVMWVDFVQTI